LPGFLVTNRCVINEDIVLGWDDILSTEVTLVDLGHPLRVVGLNLEIEIQILTSGLHDNDDIIIETIPLSSHEVIASGSVFFITCDLFCCCHAIFTVPCASSCSWNSGRENMLSSGLSLIDLDDFISGVAPLCIGWQKELSQESVSNGILFSTQRFL
jgi:hypothetical protein